VSTIKLYAEWRRQNGLPPLPPPLSMRQQAKQLRAEAYDKLTLAAELDAAADKAGEPK